MLIISNLIKALAMLIGIAADIYAVVLIIAAVINLADVSPQSQFSQVINKLSEPAIRLAQHLFRSKNLRSKTALGIALLGLIVIRIFIVGALVDIASLIK